MSRLNQTIPDAEFGALKAYFASQGFRPQTVGQRLGAQAQGRTREQILEILRTWLRTLPARTRPTRTPKGG